MDIDNWQKLGIDEEFARNQERVLNAFSKMGIVTTCTCTPYLIGNTPHFGEHIAWSESSAVCYANSVLGARTNREGGPSALASALTGYTPAYGYHLDENRIPEVTFEINHRIDSNHEYGALGKVISEHLEKSGKRSVPYIMGIENASVENLKSFCASIATYAGTAVFHMDGITPEAAQFNPTNNRIVITREDIHGAYQSMNEVTSSEIDFVSLGCPHLSIKEIARIAELLRGKKVTKEFWITTSRSMKNISDRMGYTQIIEESGAKFAADTCCVVAPIKGRFSAMATDSAKACYYARSKNKFKTMFKSFDDVVIEAIK
jgi:predicted aconitase